MNYFGRDELEYLQTYVYEMNKEKGFWEYDRSDYEICSLIMSEIGEAIEADRKGRHFNSMRSFIIDANLKEDDEFSILFKEQIKDTYQDEIADIAIRILDFMGRLKSENPYLDFSLRAPNLTLAYDVAKLLPDFKVYDFFEKGYFKHLKPVESLMLVNAMIVNIAMKERLGQDDIKKKQDQYLALIMTLDILSNIDDYVRDHVKMKLRYNSTRPYKHGKKY